MVVYDSNGIDEVVEIGSDSDEDSSHDEEVETFEDTFIREIESNGHARK
jgi:hypothetical protein